jgi:anti-anti-sigma regulatory factor
MINAVKDVRKLKGDIIAITPQGSINNIFVQTKLNIIFKQFETLDNALISFAGIGAQSFFTHIRDISF